MTTGTWIKEWIFVIFFGIILYGIMFPIAVILQMIWLPLYLVLRCRFGRTPAREEKIKVEITECTNGKFKDEILFIHGYPDTARVWDNQVRVLKKNYRCINVTMPNYDIRKPNASSWGYDFPELVKMLAEVIETKSK